MLFSDKDRWTSKPWKIMGESEMCMTDWKKLVRKDHIPYDSIWQHGKNKTTEMIRVSVASRDTSGWRRVNRWNYSLWYSVWWIQHIKHLSDPFELFKQSKSWQKNWIILQICETTSL